MKLKSILATASLLLGIQAQAAWDASQTLTYTKAYSISGSAPRDNRGIAVSNDGQYLYLGYNNGPDFRRINLSSGLTSGSNTTDRSKSIAVDDQGRVYSTGPNGEIIKIYNSTLTTVQYSITMGKCEGLTVNRESGILYLYATERNLNKILRYRLTESGGLITSATLDGLGGTGMYQVSAVSGTSGIRGIAIAPDGAILVADPGNGSGSGRISKIAANGSSQTNYTYTGANNPYNFAVIDNQIFVTQGAYSTFPSRVAVINYSSMTLAGFITPPWATLGIKTTDASDMISGIAKFPDGNGIYVTWENGSSTDESYKEPVIKIAFPVQTVQTPSLSVATGTFSSTQSVTITCSTSGASIRYTLDGTTPTSSTGTLYSGPVSVNSTATLKAIAYKSGMTSSAIASAYYNIQLDADADGVTDGEDEYPSDATRAYSNYFPASGSGSLAFEDSWPSKGDYDMNDMVVNYRFRNIINGSGYLVETYATFELRAVGASLTNGFGFQFANNNIPGAALTVTGYNLSESYISLQSNGTESGQNKPTIIVFDNAFNVLPHPGGGTGINTTIGRTYVQPVTVTIHIVYTPNTYTEAQLAISSFNPFIMIGKERGKEVHLADYAPTSLADLTYTGTKDDKTNASSGIYYKTSNNLPWALNIYESFDYPTEKSAIISAYPHFADWVTSGGSQYTNWYRNLEGNRTSGNIFTH